MNKLLLTTSLARKIWLCSAFTLSLGIFFYFLISEPSLSTLVLLFSLIATTIGSFPAFLMLLLFLQLIKKFISGYKNRLTLLIFLFLALTTPYAAAGGFINNNPFSEYASIQSFFITTGICFASVLGSILIAFFLNLKYINIYFLSSTKNINIMHENSAPAFTQPRENLLANKIWIKALITAGLILLMLIPTVFISNLVEERQARQRK